MLWHAIVTSPDRFARPRMLAEKKGSHASGKRVRTSIRIAAPATYPAPKVLSIRARQKSLGSSRSDDSALLEQASHRVRCLGAAAEPVLNPLFVQDRLLAGILDDWIAET